MSERDRGDVGDGVGAHPPASEKRLAPPRDLRGAALPGHTVVAYGPGSGPVVDVSPREDAHRSERGAAATPLGGARAGRAWIADRHFRAAELLGGRRAAGAGFVAREHARGRTGTGEARERAIEGEGQAAAWRRVEPAPDAPAEAGERTIRPWSNLPAEVDAGRTADPYRALDRGGHGPTAGRGAARRDRVRRHPGSRPPATSGPIHPVAHFVP